MSLPSERKRPGGHAKVGGSKERYEELRSENKSLREALDLGKRTIEEWLELPEGMRDRLAAEAFFREKGARVPAMARLGFGTIKDKQQQSLIFDTPGCKAIIERDLEDAEANRKPLMARMIAAGLYGDDETSVRAVQLVARMAGWQLTPESVTNVDARRITLLQLVGNEPTAALPSTPEQVQEAFLNHEPGEPVRVSSDDQIDAMLEAGTT